MTRAERQADAFNRKYAVGARVAVHTNTHCVPRRGGRDMLCGASCTVSHTRTSAMISAAGHAVVWVEGRASCHALDCIEPLSSRC